jgi:hypothetical protein
VDTDDDTPTDRRMDADTDDDTPTDRRMDADTDDDTPREQTTRAEHGRPGDGTGTALRLLADTRRRRALEYLRTHGEYVAVDRVAERLAADSPRDVDPGGVAIALRHVHLPKLAAAGAVDHDVEGDAVGYAADDAVDRLLTFVVEELE